MKANTNKILFALVVALLAGVPAAAGDATRFAIEEDQVMISFAASLGQKQQLAGTVRVLGGSVQVAPGGARLKVNVPVGSIESGSMITDAALRAALQSDQFPAIELEAASAVPGGNEGTMNFTGTMKLRGASAPFAAPVKVLRDGRLAFVHATFPISLRAFGIEEQSIAGAPVGDKVEITVDARLHAMPEGSALASF